MASGTAAATDPVAIWERIILPRKGGLTPDQARYLLELTFAPADRKRMNALAAKARRGTLNPDEDAELENYLRIGHLLGALQSRARQILNEAAADS